MKIPFVKMQAAGNDLILINEHDKILIPEDKKFGFVKKISDRHFGIGSDGVIFIQKTDKDADAKFHFFNPDGSIAEMCGNGIRCFARYFYSFIEKKNFIKADTLKGILNLEIFPDKNRNFEVNVHLGKVIEFSEMNARGFSGYYVNIGNPHFISSWSDVDYVNVKELGREIRNSNVFKNGANVHFIQRIGDDEFRIRTYERGVEDETLACGTGICAASYAMYKKHGRKKFLIHARGGDLKVEINENNAGEEEIFLIGGAEYVFEGKVKFKG
ncbi:MAG: diaminopimelate epimerase [Candidatus Altarchaeum sp. CG12_big_fil_rev_8_21_14_0_65_33_22]|nr:MAG: diaminopimelate epimerase [Candidatus Altarchaeum sp. CG12_big_fil_rev_8_21_14_0_65_33_22]